MAYRFLRREEAGSAGERFDSRGSLLYMSGMVASLYGFAHLLDGAVPRIILSAGLLLLSWFIWYETGRESPLLEISLFTGNLTFAFSNIAAMINYSATFAVGFLASLYLQVVLGLDSRAAGWILLSQPFLMAMLSPFAGRLSDRMEPRIVASAGMAITAAGLLMFLFVSRTTPLPLVIAELAIIGLGFAFFSSPNNNAILGSVGKEKYGVAASSLATMRMTGQAVSMSVVALVMAFNGGQEALGGRSAEMVLASTHGAMAIFTVLSVAGIFFSLKRGRLH
jgi:MFS family permease